VAVVLTIVHTKQIRISIHKRNKKKTAQTIQITAQTILNTLNKITQIIKHPHVTNPTPAHTHTLQNQLKQPQYKTHAK
jgi:hypothetical protein